MSDCTLYCEDLFWIDEVDYCWRDCSLIWFLRCRIWSNNTFILLWNFSLRFSWLEMLRGLLGILGFYLIWFFVFCLLMRFCWSVRYSPPCLPWELPYRLAFRPLFAGKLVNLFPLNPSSFLRFCWLLNELKVFYFGIFPNPLLGRFFFRTTMRLKNLMCSPAMGTVSTTLFCCRWGNFLNDITFFILGGL